MKYVIIDKEEAKKITGWETFMVDYEYRGVIPGYFCGYNFEVITRDGKIDFFSTTFTCLTPDELMNSDCEYYAEFIEDCGCKPTGRVIFRGYYTEGYDFDERETYYEIAEV